MCISNVKKGMKFIMNYYEILEVPYDASFSNIKSSYLRLAKKIILICLVNKMMEKE